MSIKIIYSAHIDEPVNLPEIRRQTQHWKQSDLWCQSVTALECELSDGSPKLVLLTCYGVTFSLMVGFGCFLKVSIYLQMLTCF